MSAAALVLVAVAILVLISAGVVIGWVVGTNDSQIDVLARRLAAEQQIEAMTRQTLRAMRDAVRNHGQ